MPNALSAAMPSLQQALLDNLGESVTWREKGVGDPVTVTAIYSVPPRDLAYPAVTITIDLRVSDLPTPPAPRDTITRGDNHHRVASVDRDEFGWAKLTCELI